VEAYINGVHNPPPHLRYKPWAGDAVPEESKEATEKAYRAFRAYVEACVSVAYAWLFFNIPL